MKQLHLACLLALAIGSSMHLHAQCSLSGPIINFNYSSPAGTVVDSCDINFDLSFNITNNNGNKRLFIHLWRTAAYPTPALTYNSAPTAAQLANSLGTIHIENPGPTAVIQNNYLTSSDIVPGVKVLFNGLSLNITTGTPDFYIIHNITVRVPGSCNTMVPIKGDIWSTQNNANNPSCTTVGFQFIANDPQANISIVCYRPAIANDPQRYDLALTTSTVNPFNLVYRIYIDNGDGNYVPGTEILVSTSDSVSLSSTTPKTYVDIPYLYQSNPNFNTLKNRIIWVTLAAASLPNQVLDDGPNACALLPVKLSSFTAVRKGKEVVLEWKTAQEINNAGFAIEKILNDGTVEILASVASQAPNGNSNAAFTYHFEHLNPSLSSTRYRLRQTGRDGTVEYSEIRLVNGMGGSRNINIYPNPVSGRVFHISFDEAAGEKLISLIDNTGRSIHQFTSHDVNQVDITVPAAGIYHVSILDKTTGIKTVQKVLVNN